MLLSADLLPEQDSDEKDWKLPPPDSSSSSSSFSSEDEDDIVPLSPEVPVQSQSLRERAEAAAANRVHVPDPSEEQAISKYDDEVGETAEVDVGDGVGVGSDYVANSNSNGNGSVRRGGVEGVEGTDDDGEFDEEMEPSGDIVSPLPTTSPRTCN